jgi:hypothetical protein
MTVASAAALVLAGMLAGMVLMAWLAAHKDATSEAEHVDHLDSLIRQCDSEGGIS